MITGKFWDLHDDAALWKMDAAAVRLLAKTGVTIHHEGLLDRMAAAGCAVDLAAKRCRMPETFVRKVIEHCRKNTAGDVAIPVGWNPQHHLYHGGSYPHLLDWPAGRRRLATKEDIRDMARMAHVLDDFDAVGRVLTCSEIDHRIEPLWSTLQLAETTNKYVGGGEIFDANTIEPLVRMGEVLTGEAGNASLVAACDFFIAPLVFDRKQAECFLEKRRFGLINVPGTMPISGSSAPVTLAGTVTVAVAELLAGWAFGYVVSPQIPVNAIVCSGSLDMRTTAALFGSPEACLQNTAVVQLCRRLYGIGVTAVTGYVDCKRPGIRATFEKMLPLAAAPLGVGLHTGGVGLLSAGQDYSPVQHMLDAEIDRAVQRFWGHFEVNDGTIAVDLVEQVIAGGTTDFLQREHTLERFRGEQWYPKWLDRTLWQGEPYEVEEERKMLERIDKYCKDAIRRYERPDIERKKLEELRRIYDAAERRILG